MPCEMSGPNPHQETTALKNSARTWTFCNVSNRHKTKFDHLRCRDSGNILGSLKKDDDSSESVPKKMNLRPFN